MQIAAIPAFRNREINPYNALLYNGVQQAGADVVEFGPRVLLGPSPDVLHIHWPEWLFSAPGPARARSQAAMFRTIISMLRARGTSIIWTVHNLQRHQIHHPVLELQMWQWFTANIDGWISLSESAIDSLIARYPRLHHVPHVVIPHGHYRDAYPNTFNKQRSREILGIPQDVHVFGFVGRVAPYKQIPLLAQEFSGLEGDSYRLLIAGKANPAEHRAIRAVNDSRIIYKPEFVPDSQLQLYHRAADVMVLPYRELQNSGSALMALSFDVPVLVPNLGSMGELRQQVGKGWVQTFDGPLTTPILASSLETLPQAGPPELSALDWSRLGERIVRFFSEVVSQNRRLKQPGRRNRKHRRKN